MADLRRAFGIVLKKARTSRAMTQEDLAHKSGCHTTYISELEHGKINPSFDKTYDLSHAMGITQAEFTNLVEQEYAREQSATLG